MPAWGPQPQQIGSLVLNLGGGDLPLNLVPPSISIGGTGIAAVGNPVTLSPGTWTKGPFVFEYVWLRSGVVIPGQIGTSYTLSNDDFGLSVSAEVRYTNANGKTVRKTASTGTVVIQEPYFSDTVSTTEITLSNNNRTAFMNQGNSSRASAIIGSLATSGKKWAAGFRLDVNAGQGYIGVARDVAQKPYTNNTSYAASLCYDSNGGYPYQNGGQQGSVGLPATGSVVTVTYDASSGEVRIYYGNNLVSTMTLNGPNSQVGGPAYAHFGDSQNGKATLVTPYLPAGYEMWQA